MLILGASQGIVDGVLGNRPQLNHDGVNQGIGVAQVNIAGCNN